MIKVQVVTKFKDKYTNSWHLVDEVFNVSEDRYKEIKNFVKVIEKKKANSQKK